MSPFLVRPKRSKQIHFARHDFQVQATSRALPDGWRPVLPLSADRAAELQQVSLLAAEKYRETQEEIHCKERSVERWDSYPANH